MSVISEYLLEKQSVTENARDYTYRVLKNNMIQMRFLPGEMLSEAAAANLLHVSRTPIHDTFARLAQEKLVTVVSQKGTEVTLIDPERVRQTVFVYEELLAAVMRKLCVAGVPANVLFALETNCQKQHFMLDSVQYAQIATLQHQFYERCFAACNLEKVWQAIQAIRYDMDRTLALETHTPQQWAQDVQAQTDLWGALQRRDEAAAYAQVHKIQRVLAILPALQTQYPNYFSF
ncbi:MAG: GntR family transcriptional regulator [Ruthenibacterium sp.]